MSELETVPTRELVRELASRADASLIGLYRYKAPDQEDDTVVVRTGSRTLCLGIMSQLIHVLSRVDDGGWSREYEDLL